MIIYHKCLLLLCYVVVFRKVIHADDTSTVTINGLYVYDTYKDVDLFPLQDGMTLNIDEIGTTNLTIRVDCTMPSLAHEDGYMEFNIDQGMLIIVDQAAPYFMGMKCVDDNTTVAYPSALLTNPGTHQLVVSYESSAQQPSQHSSSGFAAGMEHIIPEEHRHYIPNTDGTAIELMDDENDENNMIRTSTYSTKNYLTHLLDVWLFGSFDKPSLMSSNINPTNDPYIDTLMNKENTIMSNSYQASFTIIYSAGKSALQYPGSDVLNAIPREQISSSNTPAIPVKDYAITDATPYAASTLGTWNGYKYINHVMTLGLLGPEISETTSAAIRQLVGSTVYQDYRATLSIRHMVTKKKYTIPCYYNKNRNVANVEDTIATSGDVWLCHFIPSLSGIYNWYIDFYYGSYIAAETMFHTNTTIWNRAKFFDGMAGSFIIQENVEEILTATTSSSSSYDNVLRNGRIQVKVDDMTNINGLYYMTSQQSMIDTIMADTIPNSTNSIYNILQYNEFDDTISNLSFTEYTNYTNITSPDITTWKGGKGISLLGYINEHYANGTNAIVVNPTSSSSSLPFIGSVDDTSYYYDTSKLAQWDIIFEYISSNKGMILLFQFDVISLQSMYSNVNGTSSITLSYDYQIYIREMIARYSHHLNIIYHIMIPNSTTTNNPATTNYNQTKLLIDFIRTIDPYRNPIIFNGQYM